MPVKHAFVSPIADDPAQFAAGFVTPTRWNAMLDTSTLALTEIPLVKAITDTIGNFASPNAGPLNSGYWYDQSFHGANSVNLVGVANIIELSPFFMQSGIISAEIGVSVVTGVSGALGKILIYDSAPNGGPGNLVWASGDLSFATAGIKSQMVTFDFKADVTYWVGLWHSSTATVRGVAITNAVNMGLFSSVSAVQLTKINRTMTYGGSAPAVWSFDPSELINGVLPSVRVRAS